MIERRTAIFYALECWEIKKYVQKISVTKMRMLECMRENTPRDGLGHDQESLVNAPFIWGDRYIINEAGRTRDGPH